MNSSNNKRKFQIENIVDNTKSFPRSVTTILNLACIKIPGKHFLKYLSGSCPRPIKSESREEGVRFSFHLKKKKKKNPYQLIL